ncbi:uncharacterized protein [Salminus brasiliensis]|uniref:uncharacterized protein n=1 Tax=Salminus brasiliensis TaxID=930266 RepID=UPI003B833145
MNFSSLNRTWFMDMVYYNWCKDYPTAPLIWSGFSAVCYLMGFPASLMALCELLQRQRLKVFNNIFMISLSVIDLAFTVFIPFSACNYMIWHNCQFEWVSNFVYSLIIIGRPLFMACVCGDCHIAVIHPITYMTSKKLFVIKSTISMTLWIFIVCFSSLISSLTWMITSPVSSIPLFIALPAIFYYEIAVLRALRKPVPCGNGSIHPQKKQAIRTIFNSFIMTFIAYLPPAFFFSIGNLMLTEIERACTSVIYGVCFSMAGSVIMPILYLNGVGKLNTFKKWWKH